MESLLCENPNKGRPPYVGAGNTDNCVKDPCTRAERPSSTIGDDARSFTPIEEKDCPSPDSGLGSTALVLAAIGGIGLVAGAVFCNAKSFCEDGGEEGTTEP